jgi:hypothetical protein
MMAERRKSLVGHHEQFLGCRKRSVLMKLRSTKKSIPSFEIRWLNISCSYTDFEHHPIVTESQASQIIITDAYRPVELLIIIIINYYRSVGLYEPNQV